jgi:hypothetical protein
MFLFSLSDGIGIALLLPIWQISGLNLGQLREGAVASVFEAVLPRGSNWRSICACREVCRLVRRRAC